MNTPMVTLERDDNIGVIYIEVEKNNNPNLIISEKKLMIAPWALGYLLKMMLIHGIIHPKLLLNAVEEFNRYKKEVNRG